MAPSVAGALRDRLSETVYAAVLAFLAGDLTASPSRVGKQLRRELAGLWSARRGPYRVLYEIDDEARLVRVVRVDHLADSYRRR